MRNEVEGKRSVIPTPDHEFHPIVPYAAQEKKKRQIEKEKATLRRAAPCRENACKLNTKVQQKSNRHVSGCAGKKARKRDQAEKRETSSTMHAKGRGQGAARARPNRTPRKEPTGRFSSLFLRMLLFFFPSLASRRQGLRQTLVAQQNWSHTAFLGQAFGRLSSVVFRVRSEGKKS